MQAMNVRTNPVTVQILVPPPLAEDRPDEDWFTWVGQRMKGQVDKKGKSFNMPGAETISGRLILAYAPIWAQAHSVRQALSGELSTPAATDLRQQFLRGAPLSLLPSQSAEQFRNFTPALIRLGDTRYQVGMTPGNTNVFEASSAEEALDKGRKWFLTQRDQEIENLLEQARETSRTLGQLVRAVLAGRLKSQHKLQGAPADGGAMETVVYLNGAHDRYVVEGSDYLYGFTASASVAAVAGAIAAKSRGLRLPKPGDEDVVFVAPAGWSKGSGDTAYTWQDGEMQRSGHVVHKGKVKGQLQWKNGKFLILDSRGKRVEVMAQPEKPSELLLGWGADYLVKRK